MQRTELLEAAKILKFMSNLPQDINITSIDVTDLEVIVTFDVASKTDYKIDDNRTYCVPVKPKKIIDKTDIPSKTQDDFWAEAPEGISLVERCKSEVDDNEEEDEEDDGEFFNEEFDESAFEEENSDEEEDEAPMNIEDLEKNKKAVAKINQKFATLKASKGIK